MDGGWLPAWGWLLVLAAIMVAACLEYAYRRTPQALLASNRGRDANRLRAAEFFSLWEAACLAGNIPAAKPVPAGPAFIEYERMRREFFSGSLQLAMTEEARRRARNIEKIVNAYPTHRDTFFPQHQLNEEARISRSEFVAYLTRHKINVHGVTD